MKSSELPDAMAATPMRGAAPWKYGSSAAMALPDRVDNAPGTAAAAGDVPPLSLAWSVRYLAANLRTALPLAMGDLSALAAALILTAVILPGSWNAADGPLLRVCLAVAGGLLVSLSCAGLYPGIGLRACAEGSRCMGGVVLAFLMVGISVYASAALTATTSAWVLACVLSALFVPLFRAAIRRLLARCDWWAQPLLVVSDEAPQCTARLIEPLLARRWLGWRAVALLTSGSPAAPPAREPADEVLAPRPLGDIGHVVRSYGVYRAIVLQSVSTGESMHLLERTARWMPDVWIAGPNRQHPWPLASDRTFAIGDWRLTRLRNQLRSPTAMLIKRLLDLCVAVLAGGLALPGMLAIAAAVRLSSSGPALYGQQRIGRGGKVFRLWKFRTMFSDAEEVLEEYLERHPDLKEQWERDRKLSSDPRVVPYIGWFLRKTSLDELPQLWNVIRGEMSLVGPRPLPAYHLAQFEPSFCAYRAEVTPGITGLWQVSSRGRGEAEAYVRCDTQYIRTWSIWLDVRILLGTFGAVVSGRGAS